MYDPVILILTATSRMCDDDIGFPISDCLIGSGNERTVKPHLIGLMIEQLSLDTEDLAGFRKILSPPLGAICETNRAHFCSATRKEGECASTKEGFVIRVCQQREDSRVRLAKVGFEWTVHDSAPLVGLYHKNRPIQRGRVALSIE